MNFSNKINYYMVNTQIYTITDENGNKYELTEYQQSLIYSVLNYDTSVKVILIEKEGLENTYEPPDTFTCATCKVDYSPLSNYHIDWNKCILC